MNNGWCSPFLFPLQPKNNKKKRKDMERKKKRKITLRFSRTTAATTTALLECIYILYVYVCMCVIGTHILIFLYINIEKDVCVKVKNRFLFALVSIYNGVVSSIISDIVRTSAPVRLWVICVWAEDVVYTYMRVSLVNVYNIMLKYIKYSTIYRIICHRQKKSSCIQAASDVCKKIREKII